jgi:hypothetical protein
MCDNATNVCYCGSLIVCGVRQSRLQFAINVFNITIAGGHGMCATALDAKLFPGNDGPIMVKSAGFTTIGKPIAGFTASEKPSHMHKTASRKVTEALSMLERRFLTKSTTNAQNVGKLIPNILKKLLTTPACEVTAPLLNVQVGEVAWPGAQFGQDCNLHLLQVQFLGLDWIRFSGAMGDSARWTPANPENGIHDSTMRWVGRPLSDPQAFGDGKLFLHLMHLVQPAWRLVGDCLSLTYESMDPDATDEDVTDAATKWLKAEYKSLNMTGSQLTFAS